MHEPVYFADIHCRVIQCLFSCESFHSFVPRNTKPTCNMTYGLLTKCEVKMAGYWPSSFFASLWTETESRSINTQKKNEANIKPS